MLKHTPVLLNEMLAQLFPKNGKVYVDATFGAGGYSRAILNSADCKVIALDRDPSVISIAQDFSREYGSRFFFNLSKFSDIKNMLNCEVSGIVFDFGLSSMQIEDGKRGFSFQHDGPLDMRMGNDGDLTAAQVANSFSKDDLRSILRLYGEERLAGRVASAIVASRPLSSTFQLAEVVRAVVPRRGTIDPATKTFQALRIFVNNELQEIHSALNGILSFASGGLNDISVVTVAFHSLEDMVVKNWLKSNSGMVKEKTRGVILPSNQEIANNHRARSARLRSLVVRAIVGQGRAPKEKNTNCNIPEGKIER
jgi:16S rRNA (cytosine1402-N4)-methyltransferase